MSRQPSVLGTIVGFPVRMLSALPKRILALLLIVAVVANILTLISPPTFRSLSGLASEVVGDKTVHDLLEREKAEMQSRAERAEKDSAELAAQLADLRAENEKLAKDLAQPTVTFLGTEVSVQQAVSTAVQSMRQRVSEAATRNLASMPGKSLPFLGVSVVSATGKQDVLDACALLTNMRDLESAFVPDTPPVPPEICGTRVPEPGYLWQTVRSDPDQAWQTAQGMFADLPDVALSGTYRWVLGLAPRIFASLDLPEDLRQ